MIELVRDHPWGVVGVGIVVAAVVAGVLSAMASIPTPYAVVVALGLASPAMNMGRGGASFDRDGYISDVGLAGILFDGLASGVLGIVLGFAAVAVASTMGLTVQGLLTGLAAGGTVLGASAAFVYRTMRYRSIPGQEGVEESAG